MIDKNPSTNDPQVELRPVTGENWRQIAGLQVTEAQRAFVAEPSYYLALCCYGDIWHPLAIYLGEKIIGFIMWAHDPADNSCWLGGFIIDRTLQGCGYGKQAIQAIISLRSTEYDHFALSYQPENITARRLYENLGFMETDEWEGDEIVARLLSGG